MTEKQTGTIRGTVKDVTKKEITGRVVDKTESKEDKKEK